MTRASQTARVLVPTSDLLFLPIKNFCITQLLNNQPFKLTTNDFF